MIVSLRKKSLCVSLPFSLSLEVFSVILPFIDDSGEEGLIIDFFLEQDLREKKEKRKKDE